MKKVIILFLIIFIGAFTLKEKFSNYGPCIIDGVWGIQNPLRFGTDDCVNISKWEKTQRELAEKKAKEERERLLNLLNSSKESKDTWSLDNELKILNKINLEDDEKMTTCERVGTDFDNLCFQQAGQGYGYKKIVDCDGSNRFKKAVCSKLYKNGINIFGIYDKITNCLPENSDFEKECQRISSNELHADKIMGYNCKPMYKRAICNKKVSKPHYGHSRERANLFYCNHKCNNN